MARGNTYRAGRIHVLAEKCSTCIFRPGNPMHLTPGRVRGMVRDANARDSAIICHATLYRPGVGNAVCRGYFDAHRTTPLQIAARLDLITYDPVPTPEGLLGR